MRNRTRIALALAVSVATGLAAAQQQPPPAPRGGGAGQGGGQGRGGGQAPARGITLNNMQPIQKATASIAGQGITGTAEFNEYQAANGTLLQVVVNAEGLPPGLHGVHVHTVGKCEAPDFKSAGGHFDPGPAGNPDPDANHPFHSGDLPNLNAAGGGTASVTTYTTRFNLSGPLSLFDADGSAIVIHQNLDTVQTGTPGQGVAGGSAIACGVIVK